MPRHLVCHRSWANHRIIKLGAIYSALGGNKAAALPSFHALSGVDVTGSFSRKSKICWKVFNDASEKTLTGLAALGATDQPSELAQEAAEQFLCSLYLPNTKISEVGELCWLFFKHTYKWEMHRTLISSTFPRRVWMEER